MCKWGSVYFVGNRLPGCWQHLEYGSTEFDELQGKRDMKCRKAIMSRFFTDQKFAYIGSTAT